MKFRYLLFILLALPFFSGCNDDDDVLGIFTKHPWRLTDIFEKGKPKHPTTILWSTEKEYEAYTKALGKSDNFILNFEGMDTGGVVAGNFDGRSSGSNISGEWTVDGKKLSIKMKNSGSDAAGKEFIEGLKNAHSYDGDYNNLRIHYKRNGREFFLLFHNPDKK